MRNKTSVLQKIFSMFIAPCLLAFAFSGVSQAAEKIHYEDIPGVRAPDGLFFKYRGCKVVTLDRKEYTGRRMALKLDHVRIFHRNGSFDDLPAEQIARIEISQSGRFVHHIPENFVPAMMFAFLGCEGAILPGPACLLPSIATLPASAAYMAVSTPIFLVLDGATFFIPPKVYEIIH